MSFLLWEVFLSRCLKSYGLSSVRLSVEGILGTDRLSTQKQERRDSTQRRRKNKKQKNSTREEMKRLMLRRKDFILFIIFSDQFVMSVGCLRRRRGGTGKQRKSDLSTSFLWPAGMWNAGVAFLKVFPVSHITGTVANQIKPHPRLFEGCMRFFPQNWINPRIHHLAAGLYNPSTVFHLRRLQINIFKLKLQSEFNL